MSVLSLWLAQHGVTISSEAHLDLAKINVLLCQVKHGLAEAEQNLGVEREYFLSERKKVRML